MVISTIFLFFIFFFTKFYITTYFSPLPLRQLVRQNSEEAADGGQVRVLLARGETPAVLHAATGQVPVLLLAGHRVGPAEHHVSGHRALQPARVAHQVPV